MAIYEVIGVMFQIEGVLLPTDIHGVRTSGMKSTARRQVDWADDITLQDEPFLVPVGIGNRHR